MATPDNPITSDDVIEILGAKIDTLAGYSVFNGGNNAMVL